MPPGFATSAAAFRGFIAHNGLAAPIADWLARPGDGRMTLPEAGAAIRKANIAGDWPGDLAAGLPGCDRAPGPKQRARGAIAGGARPGHGRGSARSQFRRPARVFT